MSKLDEARAEVNRIDAAMAHLFEQRLHAVNEILAYKREHKLPVFDAAREQQVLERNMAELNNAAFAPYYRRFLQNLMDVSKDYQRAELSQNTVAYAGAAGAFASQAAKILFPDYTYNVCEDFEQVFQQVIKGVAAFGVIPFENSYAGEVGEVFDLLFKHPCHIQAIWDLPVQQNLLALPGANLSDIKKVLSHPQALSQCAPFLQQHNFQAVPYTNTALAAKQVAEKKDKTLAAIASAESAELYGLQILADGVNSSAANTTRFIVIGRELPLAGSRFNLLFTVNHHAGQLARVMSLIGDLGFNMESIKSRPIKDLPWQYYFYVEIEGSLQTTATQDMLQKLKASCDSLKVLGSYDIRQIEQ
ncbi:MAG TPA: chorismate mutase [Candidatus Avidehalobacter gallistercoris]|uniref:Bifunctional chorismate mutase/prephenate dehydratase n=1 Tax=Candidatus Avidehalobacter gallistercoris TaxID=2840694 RepID=A0A9D1HK18_9FIRM|nr:chorismate mutase [Candidatus Avidehalobacter gallistercoris]